MKYMTKCYTEARIYLEDFVRVMEAKQTVDDVHYVLALQLLGEINHIESRTSEAKKYWTKAKSTLDEYPTVGELVPDLGDIVSNRLQKAKAHVPETKSFFSRFTELARFEDEVSAELPIEERLEELITTMVFLDDWNPNIHANLP